jgi:GMP synthase-like glutamine amidotransferase
VLSLDLEPRNDLPLFQGPRWLPRGIRCTTVKVESEPLPRDCESFSHLILSGSTRSIVDEQGPFEALVALVRDAVSRGCPVLGICYGHQLVVRALLGPRHVRRSTTPEMGWLPVEVMEGHQELYSGLPNPFHVFVGHYDEVCELPSSWEVTARTPLCAVHGVINRELRVLGFQFHPEMDLAVGNTCFAVDRALLESRGFAVDRILRESRDDGSGALLIPRFLQLDWR